MFLEQPHNIRIINDQLKHHFGIDTDSSLPMWRVVWSDNQTEKRYTDRTDSGILLLTPEIRELPKYQWIKARWILEQLANIPEQHQKELAGLKKGYSVIWNFTGSDGNAVEPTFEACKFIIDTVYAALGKQSLAKYTDDPDTKEGAAEKRIETLENELFGDESSLLLRTVTGEAAIVPSNYGDGTIK